MKVGDIVVETPTFYSKAGLDVVGPQKCRVTYIHPKRRFYTVEFRSEVTGETFRECFYFADRRGTASSSEPATRQIGEAYETKPRKAMRKDALYGR